MSIMGKPTISSSKQIDNHWIRISECREDKTVGREFCPWLGRLRRNSSDADPVPGILTPLLWLWPYDLKAWQFYLFFLRLSPISSILCVAFPFFREAYMCAVCTSRSRIASAMVSSNYQASQIQILQKKIWIVIYTIFVNKKRKQPCLTISTSYRAGSSFVWIFLSARFHSVLPIFWSIISL